MRADRRPWLGVLLIFIYLILAAVPLLLFVLDTQSHGAGFWWEFALGLGFGALGMMALQFVLTARFRTITAPFGIDILYFFHRWAALTALVLILGHHAAFRFAYPTAGESTTTLFVPWPVIAGRAALIIFVVIMFTSIFRKKIKLEYDRWRILHSILAVAALVFTIIHVEGTRYNTPILRVGVWSISALALVALAHIRIVRPWLLCRNQYAVTSVKPERGDSWTVTVAPKGTHRFQFSPGQFAWLTLGSTPFKAQEHPFSISSSAQHSGKLQFTIKELGDFTRTVKNIKPGTTAYVDGPYGSFSTDFYPASSFLFIAGGVGIAPIMSTLRTLADRSDARELFLLYGNSTWDRVLFREELESLKVRLNLHIMHVLSDPPADWTGESGIITADLINKMLGQIPVDCLYFVCGPTGLIKAASRKLRKAGVPLKRVHFERFDMA